MDIKIKHFGGQYPSFNIALHTTADSEAFLETVLVRHIQKVAAGVAACTA